MADGRKSIKSTISQLDEAKCQGRKTSLAIHFPGLTITAPGVHLPRDTAAALPWLSIAKDAVTSPTSNYLAICLDLDAPYPSLPVMGPIAHGIQTDLVASAQPSNDGWMKLEAKVKPIVPYLAPGPPPMSGPHRYLFLLWEQPEGASNETIKSALGIKDTVGIMERVKWNEEEFEKKVGWVV